MNEKKYLKSARRSKNLIGNYNYKLVIRKKKSWGCRRGMKRCWLMHSKRLIKLVIKIKRLKMLCSTK